MDTRQDTGKTKMLEELRVLQDKYSAEELQLLGSMLLMAEPVEDEVSGHMMQNMTLYDAARAHRQDLLREARDYRLETEATRGQPSLGNRIEEAVGSFLVAAGRRLQGHGRGSRPAHAAGD